MVYLIGIFIIVIFYSISALMLGASFLLDLNLLVFISTATITTLLVYWNLSKINHIKSKEFILWCATSTIPGVLFLLVLSRSDGFLPWDIVLWDITIPTIISVLQVLAFAIIGIYKKQIS